MSRKTSAVACSTVTNPRNSFVIVYMDLLKYRMQNAIYFDTETSVDSSTISEYLLSPTSITSCWSIAGDIKLIISVEPLVRCNLKFSREEPFPDIFNISTRWSMLLIAEWVAVYTASFNSIAFLSLVTVDTPIKLIQN